MEEFFGKPFRNTLLGFAGLFVLSMVGYFSHTSLLILILLGVATSITTFRKLEHGLVIAFLELLSNAHGYILFAPVGSFTISARMVIFISVFVGWGITLFTKRSLINVQRVRLIPFFPILLAVGIGTIVGILNRSVVEVFQDGNAYLYFAYALPILSVSWASLKQRIVLQMLAAATVFTSAFSLLILNAYTHFPESVLKIGYVYLRDIRFAEITSIGSGLFRVFAQTQFFALAFGLLLIPRLFLEQTRRERIVTTGTLSLIFSVLFISMSRSFFFGFGGALAVICLSLFFVYRVQIKRILIGMGYTVIVGCIGFALILFAVLFPFTQNRGSADELTLMLGKRTTESDAAVSSRWNLLNPMLQHIQDSPILGQGFGQTVTFKTDDPRVRAMNPNGTWTTSSMEWGWLEIWLKMGILGPLGFLFLFFMMVRSAVFSLRSEKSWVSVWIIATLTFLYFTHIFSPYLNHPIGIGTVLLLVIFLPEQNNPFSFAWIKIFKQKMPRAELATSVVASKTE